MSVDSTVENAIRVTSIEAIKASLMIVKICDSKNDAIKELEQWIKEKEEEL